MSEQFWFKDPSVLFSAETWSRFVPTKEMTTAEALNSVVRFATYFSVLMFAATGVGAYVLAIPVMMVATILLYRIFPNGKTIESFIAKMADPENYTMPSAANPFMNVLLTEIQDNPDRGDAAPTSRSDVKKAIYKAFQQTSDLYMDTTDVFDQAQAMRTFHTIQSAKVPNDQEEFLKWLSKGFDDPDFSSAPPARHAKLMSEGYVEANGSIRKLKSSAAKPTGTTPTGPLPDKFTK
jgi:hypothetical protein